MNIMNYGLWNKSLLTQTLILVWSPDEAIMCYDSAPSRLPPDSILNYPMLSIFLELNNLGLCSVLCVTCPEFPSALAALVQIVC